MSIPREGSRDTGEGYVISIYPDVCKAPKDPCPFSIVARQSDDANTAPTVRMTGMRAHKASSLILSCDGDEAGVGTGVKSGTVGSVCEPKSWSSTVRIEGKPAVRNNDQWWMNNRNTVGELVYVKDVTVYAPTPAMKAFEEEEEKRRKEEAEKAAQRKADEGRVVSDAEPEGWIPGEQYARSVARPMTRPNIPQQRPPSYNRTPNRPSGPNIYRVPGAAPGTGNAPSTGVPPIGAPSTGQSMSALPDVDFFQDYTPLDSLVYGPAYYTDLPPPLNYIEILPNGKYQLSDGTMVTAEELNFKYQMVAKAREQKFSQVLQTKNNVRVCRKEDEEKKRTCRTGRYGSLKCEAGEQAHHIVPDYALRYGTRKEGTAGLKRIPKLPSFNDGPAICLKGHAKTAGDEHSIAHQADAAIQKMGGVSGMAAISGITRESIKGATDARPECALEIELEVAQQPSLFTDTPARTTISPPGDWPPGSGKTP